MDRSFLSQPEVIAASRNFVCIRLATYEDPRESELLRTLFIGRSGDVENTTFAILSPDGTQRLTRPHRTTDNVFRNAGQMADAMSRIGGDYETARKEERPQLPTVANVRLAVNVAACDNQPLVVLCERDPHKLRELEERVRELAWSDEFLGRLLYVVTGDSHDLESIDGVQHGNALFVVQSEEYGRTGTVLAQCDSEASFSQLAGTLRSALGLHERVTKSERHVHEGHRAGIFWTPATPVTDMMEQQARERGRHGRAPSR